MAVINWPRDSEGRIIVGEVAPSTHQDAPDHDAETASEPRGETAPPRRAVRAIRPSERAKTQIAPAPTRIRSWGAYLALGGLVVLALVALIYNMTVPRPMAEQGAVLPVPTTPPTIPVPTAPAPTPADAVLDDSYVAFWDYHNANTALVVAAGTSFEPIARAGHDWLQIRIRGGGEVWVRWRDLPAPSASLDELPDLAVPPAPAPAVAPPPALAESAQEEPFARPPTQAPSPTPNGTATVQAILVQQAATRTAIYATAAANGAPGGVRPSTPTP